jgi:hypothetical protein
MAATNGQASGLNLKLKPVEYFIFNGLETNFQRMFRCPVAWTTSTDKVRAIQQLFSGTVEYPYAVLSLQSYTKSTDRGSNKASSSRGRVSIVTTDEKRTFRVVYLPVDIVIGVTYVTNKHTDLLTFANTWMFSGQDGALKFDIDYGKTAFSIGTLLEDHVDLPLREADLDNVQEYTLETTLTLYGFLSKATLLEGQVADSIQVDSTLNDLGSTSSGQVFWSFNSADSFPVSTVASPNFPSSQR